MDSRMFITAFEMRIAEIMLVRGSRFVLILCATRIGDMVTLTGEETRQ